MRIPLSIAQSYSWAVFQDISDRLGLPRLTKSTVTGISVAIAGNIVISLALNCQKLAHRRLEREREERSRELQPQAGSDRREGSDPAASNTSGGHPQVAPSTSAVTVIETEPLLIGRTTTNYGTGSEAQLDRKPAWYSRLWTSEGKKRHLIHEADSSHLASTHVLMPVDIVHPVQSENGQRPDEDPQMDADTGSESDYLKSKLWSAPCFPSFDVPSVTIS